MKLKNVFPFFQCQVRAIRRGGFSVLLRKIQKLLLTLASLPLVVMALPIMISIRAVKPLLLVRFGSLRSERIGHFAYEPEIYLCEKDLGLYDTKVVDIFYHNSTICNQALKRMWNRTLRVSPLIKWPDRINRKLLRWDEHTIPLQNNYHEDTRGFLAQVPIHLTFTPEEEYIGFEFLKNLGLSKNVQFICFNARDSAYLDSIFFDNFGYHDYRNSSIHNFESAAKELAFRGYVAMRMGAIVKESLSTSNPRIIDYAKKYRTEFLDIFLCANCYFYLGDDCGLWAVPMIFRRPMAITNLIPLGNVHFWYPIYLFIPKKLWLLDEKRFLTFNEILKSDLAKAFHTDLYEQHGIEIVENSLEEIRALSVEMDDRLKGIWQSTEEDENLQKRFWDLYMPLKQNTKNFTRIGTIFLRENRELLLG